MLVITKSQISMNERCFFSPQSNTAFGGSRNLEISLKNNFHFMLFYFLAIDLIKKLLTVDPNKRISVDEALQHPWISVSFLLFLSGFLSQCSSLKVPCISH